MKYRNITNDGVPTPFYLGMLIEDYDSGPIEADVSASQFLVGSREYWLKKIKSPLRIKASKLFHSISGSALHAYQESKLDTVNKAILQNKIEFPLLKRYQFTKELNAELKTIIPDLSFEVPHLLQEVRVYRKININDREYAVSGQFDLIDLFEGIIWDYKEMSVAKFQFNDFSKFENQLNIYRWLLAEPFISEDFSPLLQQLTLILKQLKFEEFRLAIKLKDWKEKDTIRHDYPSLPFQQVSLPVWGLEKTESFITEHIARLFKWEEKDPFTIPICEDFATWKTTDTYPVFKLNKDKSKPVNERAMPGTKDFLTSEEAVSFIDNHKDKDYLYIGKREGYRRYCHEYCDMSAKGLCNIEKLEENELQ